MVSIHRASGLIFVLVIALVQTAKSEDENDAFYREIAADIDEQEQNATTWSTFDFISASLVYYSSSQDIEPFNETILLDPEEKSEKLGPFERISLVREPLFLRKGKPYYFPVSFNVWTRRDHISDVSFGVRKHLLKICPHPDDSVCYAAVAKLELIIQRSLGKLPEYSLSWQYIVFYSRSGKLMEPVQRKEREYHFDLAQLASIKLFDDPNRRTIFIVPGYTSKSHTDWVEDIRRTWLELEDVNVVEVDWSGGSQGWYPTPASNTRIVSRQITMFIYYAAQVAGIDFEDLNFRNNIYLIGHSLGAHIMGWVGHELRGQVGRITGLDPAGPIYDKLAIYDRLNPTNAKLVDTIHSNGGQLKSMNAGTTGIKSLSREVVDKIKSWLPFGGSAKASLIADYIRNDAEVYWGLNVSVGHVDFYANGGSIQPGCEDFTRVCDHGRSTLIYTSILKYEIEARQPGSSSAEWRHTFAFPADTYAEFQTGQYMARKCPQLISLQGDSKLRSELLRGCAVPMDFVSRVDTVKETLSKQYGIKFRQIDMPRKRTVTERPYFFETTASEKQLVSEQMLLKIHINHTAGQQGFAWQQGCHLRIKLKHDKEAVYVSYLELEPTYINPVNLNGYYGLVVPIANTADWSKYHPAHRAGWINDAVAVDEQDHIELPYVPPPVPTSEEETETCPLRDSLPSEVVLAIISTSRKTSDQCRINISHVSVQPVVSNEPFIKGHYTRTSSPKIKIDSKFNEHDHTIELNLKQKQVKVSLDVVAIRGLETASSEKL